MPLQVCAREGHHSGEHRGGGYGPRCDQVVSDLTIIFVRPVCNIVILRK